MALKVGTRKGTNPSIPPQLSFALGLLGVFILLPGSARFPPQSQQTACQILPFHHRLQNACPVEDMASPCRLQTTAQTL